jgi:PAS domain S-box-containing protein
MKFEKALGEFSIDLFRIKSLDEFSGEIIKSLTKILNSDVVGCYFHYESEVIEAETKTGEQIHTKFSESKWREVIEKSLSSEKVTSITKTSNKLPSDAGHIGSKAAIPVIVNGDVKGSLLIGNHSSRPLTEEVLNTLIAASFLVGSFLEKFSIKHYAEQRTHEINAIRSTLKDINGELDLASLLESIVIRAANLLDATGGELATYDEYTEEIEIAVCHKLKDSHLGDRQKLGEGLMGKVAQTRKPLIINDYREWSGKITNYEDIRSTIGVPLVAGNKLIGVFTTISNDSTRKFDNDDLELIEVFAQQAVIAIENAKLFNQAENEILEKEKIQQEISLQKEYYEALLVNSPVAVVAADISNQILSWNPMAEKLFGYKEDEVIGKDLDLFVANSPDLKMEAKGNSEQVLNFEQVQKITKRTHKDGSLIDVELLALPVKLVGDNVGFVATYHDLTEIKKIERELRFQNTKMSREMKLAGEIQESFLPKNLPQVQGWDISKLLKPANETSGDFYDIHVLPNGSIGIFIGDVVDKGVGAALFMALSWTLYRGFSNEYPKDPAIVFKLLNKRILEDTNSGQFLTAFYGILNPDSGKLTYVNGGHNPALLVEKSSGNIIELSRTGIPIGVATNETWDQHERFLRKGDFVVLYTDGITEAINSKMVPFGPKRLFDALKSTEDNSSKSIEEKIIKNLSDFVDGEPQFDDIALIIIKRN